MAKKQNEPKEDAKAETKAEHRAEAREAKEAKEGKKPVHKKPAALKVEEKEGFRGIVRIAGKDMKGEVPLVRGLVRVRGIGHTLSISVAQTIHNELGISPSTRVGDIPEEQMEKIDKMLHELNTFKNIPKYLLNRRGDYTTGEDKHDIMNDLIFDVTQDLERDKKEYTWKGYRHFYGQKVRGQKTRNTGRTGMAVGVLRKAIIAAQGGAAAGAKPGAAGAPAAAPAAGAKPAAAAPAAAKPAVKAPAEKK